MMRMLFHSNNASLRLGNRILQPRYLLVTPCPDFHNLSGTTTRGRPRNGGTTRINTVHRRRRLASTTTTTTNSKYFGKDTISSIPFRSVLYVPASNTRALDKVTKLFASSSTVVVAAAEEEEEEKRSRMKPDAIMYDLEDGVHPDKKDEARDKLYEYLQQQSSTLSEATTTTTTTSTTTTTTTTMMSNHDHYFGLLRINRVDTPWFHDDASAALAMIMDDSINIHGVVLPKIEGWKDVDLVDRYFQSLTMKMMPSSSSSSTISSSSVSDYDDDDDTNDPRIVSPVPLWAMIETPQAILSASEIACQSSIQGLILGTNDLSKELRIRPPSATTTTSTSSSSSSSSSWIPPPRMGLMTSLQHTILAARAHDKVVIDGVYNNIASDAANVENFLRECRQGKEIGMDGKT